MPKRQVKSKPGHSPDHRDDRLTQQGIPDPGQIPSDPFLKQALSDDRQEFWWATSTIRTMYNCGRMEAGVFLVGLLLTCGGNWEKRRTIVGALYDVQTKQCADVLFGELRRVKNTNSTRRYLKEVSEVLSGMPAKLVRAGFEALVEDKSTTLRMRSKFQQALDDLDYEDWR